MTVDHNTDSLNGTNYPGKIEEESAPYVPTTKGVVDDYAIHDEYTTISSNEFFKYL